MIGLSLAPEGRIKKAVKFICGVAVMLSLLKGIVGFDYTAYSGSLAKYRSEAERLIGESEDDRRLLEKQYIEERCRSYILDKAGEAGLDLVSVDVELSWSTDGYWYPVEAKIEVIGDEGDRYRLSKLIESELGIPEKSQTWSTADELG